MPSATYFFSAAKKSKQKMPLSNAEGLAQRKSLLWKYHLYGLHSRVAIKMSAARRTHALCDGLGR